MRGLFALTGGVFTGPAFALARRLLCGNALCLPHSRAKTAPTLVNSARMRSLKSLFDLTRERGGCFVADRYVFGLSTKHPIVSVRI